ncbi:Undecaprenyl-phosphate alpha-N-acetylglucosaminyl 1-phosphate transferase [hydrothermal vent metagenome]|uniref:Undecaprenyl-phosphate alpha-N-acetylglucosaminyl 1-phosphate transferase n=1 Tax=hydrothermal vent metagenome TaxID=652676 RepID=A0A3B1A299_9ZZZZ
MLTFFFIKASHKLGIIDIPNQRSLHDTPKPRTGGLAILIALFVGLFILYDEINIGLLSILPYGLVILAVAFVDDVYSISALLRFTLQIAVAILFVWQGISLEVLSLPGWDVPLNYFMASTVTVIFIVWVVNLYNFMDGMDGFASGMAIIGFGTFAILSAIQSEFRFAILNLIVVAAALGFIIFNLPSAKIFLGDVGSTLFGLLVALFILWADVNNIFPLWLGMIVFMPFFLDATVTLFKRILKKEKVWQAHRTHYYQRLVLLGFGHKRTLILEYTWMLVCSMVSIVLLKNKNSVMEWVIITLFTVLSITVLVYIDIKTRNNIKNKHYRIKIGNTY